MKVIITDPAKERLRRIYDYYKRKGNGKKGRQIRKEVHDKSKQLIEFPNLGQIEENLSHLGLGHRYLLINSMYKMIYRHTESVIYITDIFDTRQDPDNIQA